MADEQERLENFSHEETTIRNTEFADLVGINDAEETLNDVVVDEFKGIDPYLNQDLTTALSRVYPIDNFSYRTDVAPGALLAAVSMQNLVTIPFNVDKLTYFRYLRSAMRVSIRLNSTPFHAGLIQVSYILETNEDMDNTYDNVTKASCLPNFIISAGSQQSVDFMIPYAHPYDWFDLSDADSSEWPKIFIHALTPLINGNSDDPGSIDVTVYANFEQPEVAGLIPGYAGLVRPQGDLADNIVDPNAYEGETSFFRETINHGAEYVDEGALVPSSHQNTMARPTVHPGVPYLKLRPTGDFATMHGIESMDKLSADPDNYVHSQPSAFGDKVDYNMFSNYCRIPMLYSTTSFDSTDVAGTNIINMNVSPCVYTRTAITGGYKYRWAPVTNVSQRFRFWRGAMKYHIAFVCNAFTSARVSINWNPSSVSPSDATELPNIVNKVVDINGTTRVSFSIPYLQQYPWCFSNTTEGYVANATNGRLSIQVVNTPVSSRPETASSTIYMLVWVAGGESLQFSRPCSVSTNWFSPQGIENVNADTRELFRTEFPSLIPSVENIRHNIVNAECVNSWTELYSRYCEVPGGTLFSPWAVNQYPDTTHNKDVYTFRASFLFAKGSWRVRAQKPSEATLDSMMARLLMSSKGNYQRSTGVDSMNGIVIQDPTMNTWIEAEMPFYHVAHYDSLVDPNSALTDGMQAVLFNFSPGNFYVAVGEDFAIGFPLAPPTFNYVSTATKSSIVRDSKSNKRLLAERKEI